MSSRAFNRSQHLRDAIERLKDILGGIGVGKAHIALANRAKTCARHRGHARLA